MTFKIKGKLKMGKILEWAHTESGNFYGHQMYGKLFSLSHQGDIS